MLYLELLNLSFEKTIIGEMDPDQLRQILKEELKPIIETQKEQVKKLDVITIELHHAHQLASVTADVVVDRYEKNKIEIDEIKDHIHLPKEPYFGESTSL